MNGNHPPKILILGAGFGGLYTALHLQKQLRRARQAADITLVDRNNYFLFSPLLHEVVAGMTSMDQIVHPIRKALRGGGTVFHEWTVESINLRERLVHTDQAEISYDYLVIALGSKTQYFGLESVEKNSFSCKTLAESICLRNHVLSMFEEASGTSDADIRRRLLTFAVVGAGFTGVEMASELRTFILNTLLKDYPNIRPDEVRLLMIEALDEFQCTRDEKLRRALHGHFQRAGVEIRFSTQVADAGPGWLQLAGGERVVTDTVIWTAGVTPNAVTSSLPVDRDRGGRLVVRPTLQLMEGDEVFALGDCAHCEDERGAPLPQTAQVANQQAPLVAENLLRAIQDRPLREFKYHHQGTLASLGAYNAMGDLRWIKFTGFFAWWLWRTVYLTKMPGWNEKVRIAADWTIDLLLPPAAARIETGTCKDDRREGAA